MGKMLGTSEKIQKREESITQSLSCVGLRRIRTIKNTDIIKTQAILIKSVIIITPNT